MLLLLDLDNTLIDRDAAFRAAAAAFLAEHGLAADDLDWLMAVDASGYTPRDEVAAALAGRGAPAAAVERFLGNGGADRVSLAEPVRAALADARAEGRATVIVTNGRVDQQTAKIRNCGLDQVVDGWVVSESVGHKKPSPEIFRAAAAMAGRPLSSGWMIGDSAHADIGGACALGLRSTWISLGRTWAETAFHPSHIEADVADAIRRAGHPRFPALRRGLAD
ncbi:HAD family hydrolase [Actinoplanes sp. NPDC020271]|uniref:HAD family hydrolase n=1 Tax=Actinoplanes sp. NPDC020271 TaxID=3363896 RepID=UPI003787FEF8